MIFSHQARQMFKNYIPRAEQAAALNAYLAAIGLPSAPVTFRPGQIIRAAPPPPNPAQVICQIHVK